MNALVRLAPPLAAVALIAAGQAAGQNPQVLRPLSLAMLVLAAWGLYIARKHGDASPIHWAMGFFVALYCAGQWLWPAGLGEILGAQANAALYLILLLTALLPPLVGRPPFTTFFAKRQTPPQVWQTVIFRRINLRLNWFWAVLFALCLLLSLAPSLLGFSWLPAVLAAQVGLPLALLFGVGAPITKWYPGHYQRRLGLPGGGGPQAARDCRELLEMMPLGFNSQVAGDLKAVIGFKIDGGPENGGFEALLRIADGQCFYEPGSVPGADLIIEAPGLVWLAISRGQLDGAQSLMQGQYQARGDVSLLMRFPSLFSQGGKP